MILEVDGLEIHYSTKDGIARAVDGASFAVPEGRIVGLVGESGCGKTTAVRAIMGVLAENGRRAPRPPACGSGSSGLRRRVSSPS